jgi:hypothetical protein
MKAASRLKSPKTRPLLMPMAFMRPISRVRSCTLMSSVLTMPNAAANSATAAKALSTPVMPEITVVTIPSWSATVCPLMPASATSALSAASSSSSRAASKRAVATA